MDVGRSIVHGLKTGPAASLTLNFFATLLDQTFAFQLLHFSFGLPAFFCMFAPNPMPILTTRPGPKPSTRSLRPFGQIRFQANFNKPRGETAPSMDDFAGSIAPREKGARKVFSLKPFDPAIFVYGFPPPNADKITDR